MNATTIVAGGPGFVAGGALPTNGDDAAPIIAAIWISTEGKQWKQVDSPAFRPLRGTYTDISMLLRRGTQLVAVGRESGIPTRSGETTFQVALWTSTDAIDWQRVPPRAMEYPPNAQEMIFGGPISAAASHEGGLVLVSFDGYYVWRSNDSARDWSIQLVDHDKVCNPCAIDEIRATELGVLALGRKAGADSNSDQAVIFAFDREGNVRDFSSRFDITNPIDAISIAKLTVVVGYREQQPSGILQLKTSTTVDGEHWEQSTNFELPDTAVYPAVRNLAAAGRELLAVGELSGDSGSSKPSVWSSQDGANWKVTPLPQFAVDGWLSAAAAHDNNVVIIASSGNWPNQIQNGIFANF